MRLAQVPAAAVPTHWDAIAHWVQAATDHTRGWWTSSDVRDLCCNAQAQLWLVIDGYEVCAAVVTEIEQGPRIKICRISTLGGVGFERWGHLIGGIEDWGRRQGAAEMQIIGREGWSKALRRFGYDRRAVVMGKRL